QLAKTYLQKFSGIRDFYLRYACNLVNAFQLMQAKGCVELITSAATHAFLPLMQTEEGWRAQIMTAVDYHTKLLGTKPAGIWLPECGYAPGLDKILQEAGLAYFFVENHGVGSASPTPIFGTLSPVLSPHGVAAFPRDEACSRQVWSAEEGYPGDYAYREYYRDIGFDLPLEQVQNYIHPDGIRINTGIKYYRITGKGDAKVVYDPRLARERAAVHAEHFLAQRTQQVESWSAKMGRKPIVCAPYDSELFGHWWYEGPLWLDMLARKLHFDQTKLRMVTPNDYLQIYQEFQVCELPASSWGRGGYADVWLNGANDWIYPALHRAEQRMVEAAGRFNNPTIGQKRVLNQAVRELMLAQSSDWAFIMDSKTMLDYAVKRTKYHVNRHSRLLSMLENAMIDEAYLDGLESYDNLFPELDYRVFCSRQPQTMFNADGPTALLLTWEFPPLTVGGLSRHVYDLVRQLSTQGWQVHVVTTAAGASVYETVAGVHVHRVEVLQPDGSEFQHWALQLNLALLATCQRLIASGIKFDLVHAHDWLVCYTAKTLKKVYGLPLVATVHATEHGRNQGIHTALQGYIHHLEWLLTYEAEQVIVCSTYMQQEVTALFQLPGAKLSTIPNGVDGTQLPVRRKRSQTKEPYALPSERIVLFIGRLVREKGVQILLQAAPQILSRYPAVKFLLVGTGPMEDELVARSTQLGLAEKVLFTGFIPDEARNRVLQLAEIAVFPSLYEPFGIVAIEAMAAGTPVVVSDVGGLADIVTHGHNGLQIYPGDVNSLVTQVSALLEKPALAKKLAKTAQNEIAKYSWQQIALRTIEVYRKAISQIEAGKSMRQIAVGSDILGENDGKEN
ncbi:MAG: DUF1957 domain-containing protein, partial [Peptococcaceae bacterium]|nr:DUF1957 domain-containing protein [Peptococcaceae bacterium]